ncbi:competence type IV pilus major pilin ComGC [Sporosarcina sp. OR05]|uniref:competence type IV pilus major pilin ComGC n=1 Tax=Sporosarcina sp. OR05 TaxID=2969819 RepID=UPI00352A06D4
MKKWLQKRLKNEKGLTLVELLAVIVILGIIAAIAVPSIGGIIDNTKIKAVHSDAQNIISAASLYYIDNPEIKTEVTLETLLTEKYISDAGSFEANKASVKVSNDRKFTSTAVTPVTGVSVTYTAATSKDITNAGTKKKENGTVVISR